MPTIPFGEWLPDLADYGNPGALIATNVFPAAIGYLPVKALGPITNALDARPLGAITAKDKSGVVYNYAGDAAKLYSLSQSTWSDVSLGGGYSTAAGEVWNFVLWKQKVLATNFSDNPQSITLGGANFANLTTALKFRYIATVRDFVVAGNTFDSGDGNVPNRVRWSAFNDETDWTVSATTLADSQDLKGDGGWIQGIIGGQYGVVIQERDVWRMSFVGAPQVFQFDRVLEGIGTYIPGSIVSRGNNIYMLTPSGFISITNGSEVRQIGSNKVDRFVLEDIDTGNLDRVTSSAAALSTRIFWAYPGAGNTGGRPNKIIVYDETLDRWSVIEDDVELLWLASSSGITLDGLDDFALKTELVSTGDFATDTNWTKGTGWTIGAGVATHAAGTASDIEQTVTLTEDVYYRVEFDVINRTAGSVTPKVGGTSGTAIVADNTDIKETIRAGSGSLLEFTATSDFDGDIDNVSLKEITDMDELADSLDSRTYSGGEIQVAAFNEDFKHGFFSGTAMAATVETNEMEINAGARTRLNAFRPMVDGATVTAKVGTRNRQTDMVSFGSSLSQSASGRFTTRSNARFHRIQVQTSGNFNHAVGIQLEPEEAKKGERRG